MGKRIAKGILCVILILSSALCFLAKGWISDMLPVQSAAQRWAGDGELEFCQVSCFLTREETVDQMAIYRFRYAILDKLHEAGMEADTDTRLFRDAWCAFNKFKAVSDLASGDVSVIAVGGDYFSFHPLRLLSGAYLKEEDLTKDRILLDEESAWLFFGGTDLEGMTVKLDGVPFVVAGVVEREQDFASQKAYNLGRGIYMSYDAYAQMKEEAGAACYELLMANPVKNFVLSFVQDKFPIGQGVIVENSRRFSAGRLFALLGEFGQRSMQRYGVVYPYWENAARCAEDWCTLLLALGVLFALFPVCVLLGLLFGLIRRTKAKLTEQVLPGLRDRAGESLRKRQRRRWEKKHPGQP